MESIYRGKKGSEKASAVSSAAISSSSTKVDAAGHPGQAPSNNQSGAYPSGGATPSAPSGTLKPSENE